jgi:hypothetical protein
MNSSSDRATTTTQGCLKFHSPYYNAELNWPEIVKYQSASNYGHPRYCPERRHSLIAQPQYGTVFTMPNLTEHYQNLTAPRTAQPWQWSFKGFYYFDAPGRTGWRLGNPGYPYFKSDSGRKRPLIANGQTKYISDQSAAGLFYTGPTVEINAFVTSYSNFKPQWDIDYVQGVWEDCTNNDGTRVAHANFIGAGYPKYTSELTVNSAMCPSINFDRLEDGGYIVRDINPNSGGKSKQMLNPHVFFAYNPPMLNQMNESSWQYDLTSNCVTCGGKYNYHTRLGVSDFDEGPADPCAQPYNPWSMTVSMIYPTYVDTTSFNASSVDWVNVDNFTCDTTKTKCTNAKAFIQDQYQLENALSTGFVPSNSINRTMKGRWDELTAMGFHLHYPPENWGASFEPTKALVS